MPASDTVQTVRGPVPAGELGRVLPHEHVVCNLSRVSGQVGGYLDDPDEAVRDLRVFRALGGRTIVDCTSLGLGRDPKTLLSVSEEADVHVVMGSGWYRESYNEEDLNEVSTAELTERLVDDLRTGVDGIRPGVIGEVGADRSWVSAVEERVLRAAARAHRATGLGIVLHAVMSRVGMWQLDVLAEEEVDLRRVAVAHCDLYPDVDYHEELAKRGALVSYDCNKATDPLLQERRVRNAAELIARGWASHLLFSHDVCTLAHRERRGGPGYSYVLRHLLPDLVLAGVSAETVESIIVENPLQLLVPR